METTKIKDDFRFRFAIIYFVIALILIVCSLILFIHDEWAFVWAYYLWCLAFTSLGFWLLILKICINDIKIVTTAKLTENEQLGIKKSRLRYYRFYPCLIIVLAILSATISINNFTKMEGIQSLVASALLSFILGFFIDSIPNVIEKLGKVLSS